MQQPRNAAPADDPDGSRTLLRTDTAGNLLVVSPPAPIGTGANRFNRFPLVPSQAVWR